MNLLDIAKFFFGDSAIGWVSSAFVAGLACGGVLGWHEKALRIPAMLEQQKNADKNECNIEKQITRKANDEIQKEIARISAASASYKRLHPLRCIVPAGRAEFQRDRPGYAGGNGEGISSDWLRDFAARAESYRAQLIICKDFISSERNGNK